MKNSNYNIKYVIYDVLCDGVNRYLENEKSHELILFSLNEAVSKMKELNSKVKNLEKDGYSIAVVFCKNKEVVFSL